MGLGRAIREDEEYVDEEFFPTLYFAQVDFDMLLGEAGDKLLIIDFYAQWCGPCKMIAPKVLEMEKEYQDVLFAKVNVDENSATAERFGISAMPTFLAFKNGVKIDSLMGASEQKLREMIMKHK